MQHAYFSVQQQQLLLSQTINQRCRNSNNNNTVHLSTSRRVVQQAKAKLQAHRHTQPHTRKVCKGNIYYVFFFSCLADKQRQSKNDELR